MQHFASTRTASFVAVASLALGLTADEIAFQPKPNTEVAKELKVEVEARIASLHFTFNGEELPPEALGDFGDRSLAMHMLVGATDKYVDTKDGRPVDLLRTYDEMTLSVEAGDEKEDVSDFGEYVGKTVRFKWNADESEYEKTFHESEGDVAALEDAWEDMDLRVLLPERKVSEGDTWEVAGEKLGPLFIPGGLPGKADDDDAAQFEDLREMVEAEFDAFLKDFKVSCKYKGTREADGVSVREIAFTYDGTAKVDASELIQGVMAMQDDAPEMDVQADVTLQIKGEGVLLWDATAGHVHEFDMQAETSLDVDIDVTMEQDGQSFGMSLTGRAEGTVKWDLETKKAK